MTQPEISRPDHPQDEYYRKQSFWLSSLAGPLKVEAPLTGQQRAEVVIVGAGFTGLWTAHYLKKQQPGIDVAVVEAHTAGFGASGRNGGWAIGSCAGLEDWLREPESRNDALTLLRDLQNSVVDLGKASEQLGIDCHYEYSGFIEAAILPIQRKRLREHWQFARDIGLGEDHLQWLGAPALGERVNINGALGGIFSPHCAAIHPARLARGLAASLKSRGVRFYEQSPVTRVEGTRAHTKQGDIAGETLILATEGYTGTLQGLKRKLIPVHSLMVATEPLNDDELAATGIKQRINFSNGNLVTTYGQLTADRRLAFGCRGGYPFGGKPVSSFSGGDPEFRKVERELMRFFPALEGKRFSHAWGGTMGVSRSLRPTISFNQGARRGWAGGFFGEGVNATHLAGRTMADLVLGRDTQRSRSLWVNQPQESELNQKLWEPEPLRWLGVATARHMMGWVDSAERRGSSLAPAMHKVLDRLMV